MQRIGLLGGSFNPAHAGHLYISQQALKRLNLHQVWWLVSPKNPLKSADDLLAYSKRLIYARQLTRRHPGIRVSTIEQERGITHTLDVIKALNRRDGRQRQFIFLIGADNLLQFPLWHRWQEIIKTVPLAVFPRSPDDQKARLGKITRYFRTKSLPCWRIAGGSGMLIARKPPSLVLLQHPPHPARSTFIRAGRNIKLAEMHI